MELRKNNVSSRSHFTSSMYYYKQYALCAASEQHLLQLFARNKMVENGECSISRHEEKVHYSSSASSI